MLHPSLRRQALPAAIEEESGVPGRLLETRQILRAHSRAPASLANSTSHIWLHKCFPKKRADSSLIGNESYSKTPASRVANRQAPEADHLTKSPPAHPSTPPSEPPIIPEVNPHVLCDQGYPESPTVELLLPSSPHQAGSAPECCMGYVRTVRRSLRDKPTSLQEALQNGWLRHDDHGLLAESTTR
jgi:hypothetical protein